MPRGVPAEVPKPSRLAADAPSGPDPRATREQEGWSGSAFGHACFLRSRGYADFQSSRRVVRHVVPQPARVLVVEVQTSKMPRVKSGSAVFVKTAFFLVGVAIGSSVLVRTTAHASSCGNSTREEREYEFVEARVNDEAPSDVNPSAFTDTAKLASVDGGGVQLIAGFPGFVIFAPEEDE